MRSALVAVAVLLAGCDVADATTYTDLSSFGVGRLELRRSVWRVTKDGSPADSSFHATLDHASEGAGECPGLDVRAVTASFSGTPMTHAEPGGRAIYTSKTICSPAKLSFTSVAPSPDEPTGRLSVSDPSTRIEVDVERWLAPVALSPSPAELSSVRRGERLTLRMPGFGGADLSVADGSFALRRGTGADFESRSVPVRIEGDGLVLDLPGDLPAGGGYTLAVEVNVSFRVTRCHGAATCEVTPTLLAADYELTVAD